MHFRKINYCCPLHPFNRQIRNQTAAFINQMQVSDNSNLTLTPIIILYRTDKRSADTQADRYVPLNLNGEHQLLRKYVKLIIDEYGLPVDVKYK